MTTKQLAAENEHFYSLSGKRVFTVSIDTSGSPSHTCARSVDETKIAKELSTFLKTIKFISEE